MLFYQSNTHVHMQIHAPEIIKQLEKLRQDKQLSQLKRAGIRYQKALGIRIPTLRAMAKELGIQHTLALELWENDYHEAKLLATMLADPGKVTKTMMESWVEDFYSWDICDQAIQNVFEKVPMAWDKACEWSFRKPEFEKRAGFVLMARLAISDKKTDDKKFEVFFPYLLEGATDERNFVKKAVNWAIRQMGKRSMYLNKQCMKLCGQIRKIDNKSAQWIVKDALRELTDPKTVARIKR